VIGIPKGLQAHFQYHPGKGNVVADALSRRPHPTLNCLLELPINLYEEFQKIELNVVTPRTKPILYAIEASHRGDPCGIGYEPTIGAD